MARRVRPAREQATVPLAMACFVAGALGAGAFGADALGADAHRSAAHGAGASRAGAPAAAPAPGAHPTVELIGTWRGTSTCVDRVAVPGCHDEVVVYEFTDGAKPGMVHWKAYKIVKGEQLLMGEMDLAWDADEACWIAEYTSPRATTRWSLSVDGPRMTGDARLLPGREIFRRIEAHRDAGGPGTSAPGKG